VTHTALNPQHKAGIESRSPELLQEISIQDRHICRAERLRLFWGHRQFILSATAMSLLLSALVAFLIPKSYTSTAQLMPPDTRSTSGAALMATLAAKAGGGGLGSMATDLLGFNTPGALFVGILRSQTCQDQLVQQFDLTHVYAKTLSEDAAAQLQEDTTISEDRKSGIITISVTDRSPQRAAALANAYIEQLNLLITELSTSSAHRERLFLEDRLKVAKEDLDEASNQFGQFASKNSTLEIQQMGRAMLDTAGKIAGELIAAESQLEGLRQLYTDDNARVQSLSARIAELRKELGKLGGSNVGGGNNQGPPFTEAADPPGSQPAEIPYPTIRSLPLLGIKYADYYRRAKTEETVYTLLTEQYELAKIQEAKETPTIKILDSARIPHKKSFPPRLLIMFLGTFVGVSSGLLWVVGSTSWQAIDPQDPRKILAREVFVTLKVPMLWASRNGHEEQTGKQLLFEGAVDPRTNDDGRTVPEKTATHL
jgi:capsule polysaccharide export protein KpsE/RkpR